MDQESEERVDWSKVGLRSPESIQTYMREPKRESVDRWMWRVRDKSKREYIKKKRGEQQQALGWKVDEEKYLKIRGRLREGMGMKTYLHDPVDTAKKDVTAISGGGREPTRKEKGVYQ